MKGLLLHVFLTVCFLAVLWMTVRFINGF